MIGSHSIKINFRGGIISPGELLGILQLAKRAGIHYVSFGLRQQLLIHCDEERLTGLTSALTANAINYEADTDQYPNIISSYPAEEVFITDTWLSEGVYKDIFDSIQFRPRLKMNISDCNQSFTPVLTGNINWVASPSAQHFWHLIIRFPRTNKICEWNQVVYTNDLSAVSELVENIILSNPDDFVNNESADGEALFARLNKDRFILKEATAPVRLPTFNLPYYEGLNRYNNSKSWLGVYRRDEQFHVGFLKEVCLLALATRIGQICCTPWKSIIIKGIEGKDRENWIRLLEKYNINMRHAANELNFQVEDDCDQGLALKNYLVKHLNDDDIRSFGVCIGIKTRRKSEIFSSILIRRRPLFRLGGIDFFPFYDILCAHEFNPNERTGSIFSRHNPKFLLAEQLRQAIFQYYRWKSEQLETSRREETAFKEKEKSPEPDCVYQCSHCLTVYDHLVGDASHGIEPGTAFLAVSDHYRCPVCDAEQHAFHAVTRNSLGLQPV